MNRELKFKEGDDQVATLWHYTDSAGLCGLLLNREIWATHNAFLNDRNELIHGEALVHETVKALAAELGGDIGHILTDFLKGWDNLRLSAHTPIYVASFCSDGGDRLSQWRGYGGRGAGYAAGFKSIPMLKAVTPGPNPNSDGSAMLVKIIYSEDDFRNLVRSELEFRARGVRTYCRTHHEFAEELFLEGMKLMHIRAATLALRCKHPKFTEEDEWRLVVTTSRRLDKDGNQVVRHRSSRSGVLVPYVPVLLTPDPHLDLEGVRVGPAHEGTTGLGGLRSLLTSLGYENADALAVKSEIPFRE